MEGQETIQQPAALWQWQSDPDPFQEKDPAKWTWKNYSEQDCLLIEEAFHLNKEALDLQDYQIDFKKMLQINKKFKSRIRRIRRQAKSRFMIEMPEPKIVIQEQKTMNEAFGTIQHFLDYIIKRTHEAYGLYQRLKTLPLDSISYEFEDIIQQVTNCLMKGAEARERIVKKRTGLRDPNFVLQAQKIVNFIPKNWVTLSDFLKALLQVYTMETFICYWLNELLRSEDWQEINVLTPYLVCLVYTFQLSEFNIQYQEPQKSMKNLLGLFSTKKKLYLYRGTVLTKQHLELYNCDTVKYFSWNGVTSTSRNKSVAMKFIELSLSNTTEPKIGVLFRIKANFASLKDSEGMIDISQDSQHPGEQEIILAPGTVFQLRKIQLAKDGLYKIKLKVTRKFKEKQKLIPLLGILHDEAIQDDTAVIEGFPSQQSFKLFELLKGNKLIRKLEIKNSIMGEHLLEEIENMRATTNVKKQDIHLQHNTIVVSNLAVLPYYFSSENLNQICEENHIEFCSKSANSKKNFTPGLKISLDEKMLEKFQNQNQWEELWDTMSHIQTLDVSMKDLHISDDEFKSMTDCITELKSLQNLKLILNKYQTENLDLLWEAIKPLNALKKLDLELKLSRKGLNLCKFKNSLHASTSLQRLSLRPKDSTNVTDEDLDHLKCRLITLKSLQHLSLEFGWCEISDIGLNHLLDGLIPHISLYHLSLQFRGSTITNIGLNSLKNGLISLKSLQDLSLDFSSSKIITDKGLDHLKYGLITLKSLQYLSLNFGWCEQISDDGLSYLKDGLKSLISLRQLSLSFESCQMISDEGLVHLKKGLRALKSLETLSLKFDLCKKILNEGLYHLNRCLESLKFLQSLSLSFFKCDNLSDKGLNYLKGGLVSHRYLQDLSLRFDFCKKISDEGLDHLKFGLKSLILLQKLSLSLLGCDKISNEGKLSFKSELASLPSLHFAGMN